MIEMKLHHVVYNIVSKVFLEIPYKDRDLTKGLHLSFDVSLSSYEDEKQYSTRTGLHLVYHAPTNYVTVFSGITESPFGHAKNVKEWKHESTHDSCWRDIHVFSDLYFQNAEKVNSLRERAGLKTIPPKDMVQNVFFSGFSGNAWDWIPIEISRDPNDEHGYRKVLKLL